MPKTKRQVESDIKKVIGPSTLSSIKRYVSGKKPHVWGKVQPKDYTENCTLLAIYKITHGEGYDKLYEDTKGWGCLSKHSLMHNTKLIRPILGEWGKNQIKVGNSKKWKIIASHAISKNEIKNINLWMDSVDFRLRGSVKNKKKNPYYSKKEDSLARRFQFVIDADLRIRLIRGGYSPKIFDSHWIESNKVDLETNLQGAVLVADNHYHYVKTPLHGIDIISPPKRKKKPKTKLPNDQAKNSKEEDKTIREIHEIRARVESPFGQLKGKFKELGKKFADGHEDLDHTVYFASGVYNRNLKTRK